LRKQQAGKSLPTALHSSSLKQVIKLEKDFSDLPPTQALRFSCKKCPPNTQRKRVSFSPKTRRHRVTEREL
jgi:hypothetical protein